MSATMLAQRTTGLESFGTDGTGVARMLDMLSFNMLHDVRLFTLIPTLHA